MNSFFGVGLMFGAMLLPRLPSRVVTAKNLVHTVLWLGITLAWSGVVALAALWVVGRICRLRVDHDAEREGLDISAHGESAYST